MDKCDGKGDEEQNRDELHHKTRKGAGSSYLWPITNNTAYSLDFPLHSSLSLSKWNTHTGVTRCTRDALLSPFPAFSNELEMKEMQKVRNGDRFASMLEHGACSFDRTVVVRSFHQCLASPLRIHTNNNWPYQRVPSIFYDCEIAWRRHTFTFYLVQM